MANLTIQIPPIFSFKECLAFLNRSKNECLFYVENERVRKLFIFKGNPVLIEFYINSSDILEVKFLNSSPTDQEMVQVKNYIENWLDFRYDMLPFYKMAKSDKILKTLIKQYAGLRLIGVPDFFEAICWAIIGQQINLNFAYSVKKTLVERYGDKFKYQERNYFQFPTADKLLDISNQEFLEMKFSKQKAAYIRAISNKIVDQSIDIEQIRSNNYDIAKKELTSLYGIGNWSADYILMKTFRHPQAFPIQDAGLQNALKRLLKLPKKPGLDKIQEISKPWGNYEAYATFYLWRSLYE